MLRLEGAIVFVNDNFHDVPEHFTISLDFFIGVKQLVYNKMHIPLKDMAIDAGVIVMIFIQKSGHLVNRIRKVFNMEGYIFDDACRPLLPHAAHRRKNAGPDSPKPRTFRRV